MLGHFVGSFEFPKRIEERSVKWLLIVVRLQILLELLQRLAGLKVSLQQADAHPARTLVNHLVYEKLEAQQQMLEDDKRQIRYGGQPVRKELSIKWSQRIIKKSYIVKYSFTYLTFG